MRRAGTVLRIAQGRLVVRAPGPEPPDFGETVLDEHLESVGTIVDVFGPVDRPYLTVVPLDSINPPSLLNEPLYLR
ncbi:MAG: H/ACA ribonucleoprotein complex subunit GAR1 [Halodesulfurarchaeum sp.]